MLQAKKIAEVAPPRANARGEIRKVNPPLTPEQEEDRRRRVAAAFDKVIRENDELLRALAKM
jgi:hypothetical protein